jgi:hypothetical protein
MLVSLADAFVAISSHKKKFGVYGPKRLIQVFARCDCSVYRTIFHSIFPLREAPERLRESSSTSPPPHPLPFEIVWHVTQGGYA